MSEQPSQSFVVEKDEFVLDQTGNAFQMQERLGYLIEKHKTLEGIEHIMLRDNPDAKKSYSDPVRESKNKYVRYEVGRQHLFKTEIFIAVIKLDENNNIIGYSCNIGDL